MAIALMLDTGLDPAGHQADLNAQADMFRRLFLSVTRHCGVTNKGKRITYTAAFGPKQLTAGGLIFSGARLAGISRRPRWLQGSNTDATIAINLLRARQRAINHNTNFGQGYICTFHGLSAASSGDHIL